MHGHLNVRYDVSKTLSRLYGVFFQNPHPDEFRFSVLPVSSCTFLYCNAVTCLGFCSVCNERFFPGGKEAGTSDKTDHSPPSSVKAKSEWRSTSTS